MLLHEIAEAAKQGARLIEVRLDFLKKAPDFKRFLDACSNPVQHVTI